MQEDLFLVLYILEVLEENQPITGKKEISYVTLRTRPCTWAIYRMSKHILDFRGKRQKRK